MTSADVPCASGFSFSPSWDPKRREGGGPGAGGVALAGAVGLSKFRYKCCFRLRLLWALISNQTLPWEGHVKKLLFK